MREGIATAVSKSSPDTWLTASPKIFGGTVALISLFVLAGWLLDNPTLKSIHPDFVSMKPNTAVGLLLLGAALFLLGFNRPGRPVHVASEILSLTVAAIGMISLAEHVYGTDFGIDQLLFKELPDAVETSSPGRMAFITCICFTLTGAALYFLAVGYPRLKRLPDLLLLATALMAAFVLLGYMYDDRSLRELGMSGAVALHTAAAFLLVALAALTIKPTERIIAPVFERSPAGVMLRWILPSVACVPVLVEWLRVANGRTGVMDSGVTISLSVILNIALLVVLCLFGAAVINRVHKRALALEKAARENDRRLRALLDNTPVAVYMKDCDGRFIFVNRHLGNALGRNPDELVGTTVFDLFSGELATRFDNDDRQVLSAGKAISFEESVDMPSGRIQYLSSKFPILDENGRVFALGGVSADITERKRMESEINKFFELSNNLLCIADMDGYFVKLNPVWEKTLGFTVHELTSKRFIDFVHPDDRVATLSEVQQLATGEHVIRFENRYLCKNGTYRTLLWNSVPALDKGLIYAAANDITERKKAEQEIAELNKVMALRAVALEAANAELEAFSYSVSHDLRAPLRSIDGFSQALVEDYTDRLDPTALDYLTRVRAATQRMAQLIDDMLQLSRVTRLELHPQVVDLSATARGIIANLKERSIDRSVTVSIDDGLMAEADPRLMRIVLENLLANSWKYTSKKTHANIAFGAMERNGVSVYYVRDDGVGFDMNYADKLFGAFQRLHGMDEFEGTGIGLATVKRIIHRHGGRVWAEAAVDQGATFYFALETFTECGGNYAQQGHLVGRG